MGHGMIRRPFGYGGVSLKRIHQRIFRLNDKIAEIEREEVLVVAELDFHRSINDDAQRDAAVGNYIDREEAVLTAADVRRFEKTLKDLGDKRDRLERKRDLLMSRVLD